MVGRGTIEVAKTVLEVADVAWTAVERCHHHDEHEAAGERKNTSSEGEELESLRSENRRLRNLLEQNLKLLQKLSESPCLLQDCPPDLYARLAATVHSKKFLTQLKSLHHESVDGTGCKFPFKEASGADLQSAEVLINVDPEEPSWWVWVTDEMVPRNVEELSGIDNENYVIVSEEHVVDGVANFMARCILSNPKAQSLTPEELQISLTKAFGGMNKLEKMLHVWHAGKMFYTLSTWGLALAGLYRTRAILRIAAMGIHTTSKVVLGAL
uniref:RRP15-like protein n=1 Tax=Davidia involucrata TaxID=16924 RepID=A0A5B6YHR8_DAVIN